MSSQIIQLYICIPILFHSLSLFDYYNIFSILLCYTVGPSSLSILCIVCICKSQPPNLTSPPFPFGSHSLFFISVGQFIFFFVNKFICIFSDFTEKQCHMIFVFPWFTSLSRIISRSIHAAIIGIISLFFYVWVILHFVCVYIYICMCVSICPYHIFIIHSSVDGHLGCFHSLATINNASWTLACMYPNYCFLK